MRVNKILSELLISLLILFWVYAAIIKLLDYNNYWAEIEGYVGDMTIAKIVAIGLPLIQLGIGSTLPILKTRSAALFSSLLLITFFTCYVAYILFWAEVTPCQCMGIVKGWSWMQHLILDIVVLITNIIAIVLNRITDKQIQQSITV